MRVHITDARTGKIFQLDQLQNFFCTRHRRLRQVAEIFYHRLEAGEMTERQFTYNERMEDNATLSEKTAENDFFHADMVDPDRRVSENWHPI